MNRIIYFAILVFFLFSTEGLSMERFNIVTTEEIKQLLEDRAAGQTDFILVNTLDEIIYLDSSIPGSISVPWGRVDKLAHRLGDDKDKLIITY